MCMLAWGPIEGQVSSSDFLLVKESENRRKIEGPWVGLIFSGGGRRLLLDLPHCPPDAADKDACFYNSSATSIVPSKKDQKMTYKPIDRLIYHLIRKMPHLCT